MLDARIQGARVLIVDDEPHDVSTLKETLNSAGFTQIISTSDSSKALRLYQEYRPDIVLLDLHMPQPNGIEVMQQIADHSPGVNDPPIIMFTNIVSDEVSEAVLNAGAVDFIRKPQNRNEVLVRVTNLLENYFLNFELLSTNEVLEEKVKARTQELNDARMETLERLAIAAEFRDDDTGEHTRRVGRSSCMLAKAIGWEALEVERMRYAAPLHDVGKIGISDGILLKPGRLTDEEFAAMRTHTTIGKEILEGGSSHVLALAGDIAISHHEKWDGNGYPNRLAGNDIPLPGRIVALADVFDALTNARPYKKAWPWDEAAAEIAKSAGTHFDPELADVFVTSVIPAIAPKETAATNA